MPLDQLDLPRHAIEPTRQHRFQSIGAVGRPVYQPPAFFWWWFAYDAYAHEIFVTGGFIAGGMARPTRFERVTSTFGGWRSIQLSYGRISVAYALLTQILGESGVINTDLASP